MGNPFDMTSIRHNGRDITFPEAITLMGEKEALDSIAYAAEHVTKAVITANGDVITFNSLPYFLQKEG